MRQDALHKLTTHLARDFKAVGIEDLNVNGMIKNHCLARYISDQAFGEFRRQLTYKCQMTEIELKIWDCWYPSSKTCSNCNYVIKKLPLNVREWVCPSCGIAHDRDFNASKNLKPSTPGLGESNACGFVGSGLKRKPQMKPTRVKQELTFTHKCVKER
jgi:putative transposase